MSTADHVADRAGPSEGITGFSTISSKGQTTVPKAIRQVLGTPNLKWRLDGDRVVVEAASADQPEDDPVIGAFLALLDRDIAAGGNLHASLPADLAETMRKALRDVRPGDYDQPLPDADDIDFGL